MPNRGIDSAASFHEVIKRIWYPERGTKGRSLATGLLSPPALFYRGIIQLRNRLYDREILRVHRMDAPVISVGNITVGGTGKTPAVIMIAGMLATQGFKPAILSRGYGGASRLPVNIVSDGKTLLMHPDDAGDEPVLMARRLPNVPVLTGPERALTGRAAIDRLGADVLVLDDAFQHRQIHRDIDIVLVDRQGLLGNGRMLPAGPLREPASGTGRADAIILTGIGKEELPGRGGEPLKELGTLIKWDKPLFESIHRPQDLLHGASREAIPFDCLRGKRIFAFAGIASPTGFRKTLEAAGARIVSFLAFDDHHRYTDRDICDMGSAIDREGPDLAVTTEKDGVKLAVYRDFMRRIFQLRISMEVAGGPDDFREWLLSGIESWKKRERRQ